MAAGAHIAMIDLDLLRCPRCKTSLLLERDELVCMGAGCELTFPLIDGVPVLLNSDRSLFDPDDFHPHAKTTFSANGTLSERIGRWLPSPSRDLAGIRSYRRLADELRQRGRWSRRVLVVGCGDGSATYGDLQAVDGVAILETDVSLAGPATLVCDASDLPFADARFDVVICQAVLEHVLEPQRCVDEMHRVLVEDGLIYATTPFMQHVHMGAYDFTRFTHSGFRWLHRHFTELDSGVANGPGSMLAWSLEYFFLSFVDQIWPRRVIKAGCRLFFSWLTLFDFTLAKRRAAYDSSGGFFFLGRRATRPLKARAMTAYYRGADSFK
jgi:SAM-dependent methyltransferase/uncharacterized protein YbaR (Trm112 family)